MKNSTHFLSIFITSMLLSALAFAGVEPSEKLSSFSKPQQPGYFGTKHFEKQYKAGRYPMSESSFQVVKANLSRPATTSFAINDNHTTKPSQAEMFDWENGSWTFNRKEQYSYDSNGNLLESIVKDEQNNNVERLIITYNTANMATVYKFQLWQNNAWVNVIRDSLVYNTNNNATAYFLDEWSANTWANLSRGVYTYVYDANNRITDYTAEEYENGIMSLKERKLFTYTGEITFPSSETYQEWSNDQWVNDSLITYTLNNANQWIQLTGSDWVGNNFVEKERYTDLVWHNYDEGKLSFYKYQEKGQSDWMDVLRASTDFTRADSIPTVYEMYQQTTWMPFSRYTEFFDGMNTYSGYRYEVNQGSNWSKIEESRELHTYNDANAIAETIYKTYDTNTQTMVNSERVVYQYGTVAGSKKNKLQAGIKLYPNPVHSEAVVQLELQHPSFVSMKVTDVSGKVVEQLYEATLYAGKHHFDLNTAKLKSGVYHLQIVSDEAVSTRKFVVVK